MKPGGLLPRVTMRDEHKRKGVRERERVREREKEKEREREREIGNEDTRGKRESKLAPNSSAAT
jgi:hypothetical protein